VVVGANGCTVLAVASSRRILAGARAMLLPRLLLPRLLLPLEQQRARALMALAQTATGADDTEKSE